MSLHSELLENMSTLLGHVPRCVQAPLPGLSLNKHQPLSLYFLPLSLCSWERKTKISSSHPNNDIEAEMCSCAVGWEQDPPVPAVESTDICCEPGQGTKI